MDPDVALRGLIETARLYEQGKLSAREAADALSSGLRDLTEHASQGGYQPSWPDVSWPRTAVDA